MLPFFSWTSIPLCTRWNSCEIHLLTMSGQGVLIIIIPNDGQVRFVRSVFATMNDSFTMVEFIGITSEVYRDNNGRWINSFDGIPLFCMFPVAGVSLSVPYQSKDESSRCHLGKPWSEFIGAVLSERLVLDSIGRSSTVFYHVFRWIGSALGYYPRRVTSRWDRHS